MRSTGTRDPPTRAGSSHTIESYFSAFAPTPSWDELPAWPPDVFALSNLILDHTEVFRFAVSPPPGRRWPPMVDWNARVGETAMAWRTAAGQPAGERPPLVRQLWGILTNARAVPLSMLRAGDRWEVSEALLTLHALADEACAGLAAPGVASPNSFEARAWALLAEHGSLSRVSPGRVRITPKVQSAARGMTIRSLSRYLALCYESVDVRWHRIEPEIRPRNGAADQTAYNLLLLPWPLSVAADDFRPVSGPLDNMDARIFGFFQFAPEQSIDMRLAASVLDAASEGGSAVDAVLLPEASVEPEDIPGLEVVLENHGVDFLVAGGLKWLLGGPGIVFLYARADRIGQLAPAVAGWFGHREQFAFDPRRLELHDDARRFELGTPSLAAVHAQLGGLEYIEEIGVPAIRAVTAALTEDLIARARERGYRPRVATDAGQRSAIVTLPVPDPGAAVRRLADAGIIVDARPGHVRFSPFFYNVQDDHVAALERLAAKAGH